MKVTLKQARRIEEALAREARDVSGHRSDTLQEVASSPDVAQRHLEMAADARAFRAIELQEARTTLRELIGQANQAAGINSIIALIGTYATMIRTYQELSSPITTLYQLNDSVQRYTYTPNYSKEINQLRFKEAEQKDRATALNNSTFLELPEHVVKVAETLGLLGS